MYFKNRKQAGKELAKLLEAYRGSQGVVMALTEGGIKLGRVIAKKTGFDLTVLLMKDVVLPGEDEILGIIDQSGGFTYNSVFSSGEIEELTSEFHNYIEAEKMNKTFEINRILNKRELVEREQLRGKVVILVTDGAKTGVLFDAAASYLKPVAIERLIATAPVASVSAVDRMHILADEIHVLSVTDNYLDTNHYYENNKLSSPVN